MGRLTESTPTEPAVQPPLPVDATSADHSPTEVEIIAICRTAVGDALRSVIHFTRDDSELLYLRKDLYGDDRRRALEVKANLVERERVGFTPYERYEPHAAGAGSDPALGDYEFTVRVFSDGFVCRVIVGAHGLLLTAEDLDVDRVEEVAVALRGLVATAYGPSAA
ncbi:DUF7522 family protein [Salinigranum halophilum]|jgi:hypothetical protein|uniref:DUF7522 family protein n=1 Tax=Salinigranum halophilum TaxID=2565931 RepID=UPI001F458C8E|nr:hypothetical protein [Salinigranum halophilum]